MSNNLAVANNFLKSSLKGEGEGEKQNSPLLNLPRPYYLIAYLIFTIAYLEVQFGPRNFFLQVFLILIIITAPGQAILAARVIDFSNQILNYFFGLILSLITLMFVFATLTLFLPLVGITQLLTPVNVGIVSNILVGASLYFCAKKTNSQKKIGLDLLSYHLTKRMLFLIFLPIFSFYATFRQNAYHESVLSLILFVIVFAVLIVLMSVKRIYRNDSLVVALFYFASLAIFIALSYRGETGFSGYDINSEYRVANNTLIGKEWIAGSDDAYNSMLSITILPVVLTLISKFSLLTIFKFFYISIAALIPGILYIFFRKYADAQAAIISIVIFVIAGASYFGNLTALARQIVGLLLFIGILIVLFETKWSFARRQRFIFVLTLGLSFSHYSSAYIFAGMAFLSAVIYAILYLSNLSEVITQGSQRNSLFSVHKSRVLTIPFALILILIVYSWNGVVTQSSQNLQSTISVLIKQRDNLKILPNKDQGLILRYLAGNVAGNELSNEDIKRASIIIQSQNFPTLSIRPETYNYVVKDADLMGTKSNSPNQSVVVLTNLLGIAKIIPQALVTFTIFILLTLYLRFRRRSVDSSEDDSESGSENSTISLFESQFEKMKIAPHLYDLTFLTLVSFVLAIIARSSGLVGKFYNTDRLALQMGMIWTLPLAIVLTILFSHFKWGKLLSVVLILCAVIQLNLQLGFLNVLRDDFTDKITAKNWQANSYNVSKEMFTTQKWIVGKIRKNDFLQSDCTNFVSFGKFTVKGYLYKQSMPYNLDSGAFIYAGPNNLRENIYYDCSGKVFEYPISFVETYYSPVYVSDSTAVFR